MRLDIPRRYVERLAALPTERRRAFLAKCSPEDLLAWDAMFECWAHEAQVEPAEVGWRCWLMMAGRGFGKTRAGAEWVNRVAAGIPRRRIALVGATIDEARSIMIEGNSGLLSVARRLRSRVKWEPSRNQLRWPNGSIAELYSGEKPDGLRGQESHFAWADELAKWRHPDDCWANLNMGLRGGPRARKA